MAKKGQVTAYIIIGGVILLVGAILFIPGREPLQPSEQQDTAPIKAFVEGCLRSVAEEGLQLISLQGGSNTILPLNATTSMMVIPYYWFYGENRMPTIDAIESSLADYVQDNIPACLGNFSTFEGIAVEAGASQAEASLTLDKVFVKLHAPLRITSGSSITQVDTFASELDFSFREKYDIVRGFMAEQEKSPDAMPIGYLANSASLNNFTFDIMRLNVEEILYSLSFGSSEDPFVYAFAAKYNWSGLFAPSPIDLLPIPPQEAFPGYSFTYTVKATGNNVLFTDYSPLFDIDEENGTIAFTPTKAQAGDYSILIKAFDEQGNQDTEIMKLSVVRENDDPVLLPIGDLKVKVGNTLNFFLSAADPDNDTLFYDMKTTLRNITLDVASGELNFAPVLPQRGNYSIIFTVTDPHSNSDREVITMEVTG